MEDAVLYNYTNNFGYADDLALVCPTLYGLKQMIVVCEEFASEFNIMFNPKKSKLKKILLSDR